MAVQGFGNAMGSYAALLLSERGCTIQAVSDISGAYYMKKESILKKPLVIEITIMEL